MIRFKKITIKNSLSYGNSPITIDLDSVGTTLIVGEDKDNTSSGTGANGVGKTVWVNAIIFALYGKPISNISLNNLVNNINKKDMRVEVEFLVGKELITIRRARKEKGVGDYAKVFIRNDGDELDEELHDETPDSIANANDFIENKIGIPFELFVRIVTFTATHTAYLDLPLRQQSDIMEELFRLRQLSTKAGALKKVLKSTKQSLEIKTKHNEQLEKEHRRHQEQITSAKKRVETWKDNNLESIGKAQSTLDSYTSIPVKAQEKLHHKLAGLQESLAELKVKQRLVEGSVTAVNSEFTVVNSNIKRATDDRERVKSWKREKIKEISNTKKNGDSLPHEHELDEAQETHDMISALNDNIKLLVTESGDVSAKIKSINDTLATTKKELVHLEDAKCPYCLQKYEDVDTKIKEHNDTIRTKEQELHFLVDEQTSLQAKLDADTTTVNEHTESVKYTDEQVTGYRQQREACVEKLQGLYDEKNNCPYGSILPIEAEIVEYAEVLAVLKVTLDTESDKLLSIDDETTTVENGIVECEDKISIKTLDELYEIKSKITQHKERIKILKAETNPYNEPLEELMGIVLDAIDIDDINRLDKLIVHQNYLLRLLTKKDSFIRKNLLMANLTFLNERLRMYLVELGLPHRVEFTQEMSAKITQFGRELDFGNLSSGQKARVNLALSFSFRDVLQKSHSSINICMLDEVLDVGLDSVGVQNAAKMLNRKATDENLALYIISHRDEVSNIFYKKMTVLMERGFSSIKVDDTNS